MRKLEPEHEEVIDAIIASLLTPDSLEFHGFGDNAEFGQPPPEDEIRGALRSLFGFMGSTRLNLPNDGVGPPDVAMINIVPRDRIELMVLPSGKDTTMVAMYKPNRVVLTTALRVLTDAIEAVTETAVNDPDDTLVKH